MKTLQVVLCHNLPDSADRIYENLAPYKRDDYDIILLDNGSKKEGRSKYTGIDLNTNAHFGGGFQYAVDLVLSNQDKYDSLLFTINTLSLFGYSWVKSLRHAMFNEERVGLVSPSIIAHGKEQNAWPQMHNWGLNVPRKVRWVDFQSPLIHVDILKKINTYPDFGLAYGYDVYTGIVVEEMGYKAYVLDYVYAVHQKKETFKTEKADITIQEYGSKSLKGMYEGFTKIGMVDKLNDMRNWASNYVPKETLR